MPTTPYGRGELVRSDAMHGIFGTVEEVRPQHRFGLGWGEVEYLVRNGAVSTWIDVNQIDSATWEDVQEHFQNLLRIATERKIDWTPVSGLDRSERYVSGEYRGMHCELFNDRHGEWNWSFYDDNSDDPDLAVARETCSTRDEAERELMDYIDGYVAEER